MIGNKTVFKGRFLEVKNKAVKLPNNRETIVEYIDHPGAVLIIPFLSPDELVMIKQYRPTIEGYLYELPAGTIEKGEDILECAKREIIEEIGYEAKKWQKLGFIYPCPGYSTERIFIFKAQNLESNISYKKDEDEVIETKLMKKSEIQDFLKRGLITDSKTISALVFCGLL